MARPKKVVAPSAAAPAPEAAPEETKVRKLLPRPAELQQMIQTAAYFIAEKDGFRMAQGFYWKEAESEILSRFK